MTTVVNNVNFNHEVLEADHPVLVDFYATWCGPCRMQSPILDELAREAGDAYSVVKVDADQDPDLATKYGVTALPTLLVFSNGQVSARFVGLQQKETLKNALQRPMVS